MLPHKTARGAAALDRLTVHDGCPHPYDMKKVVVPQALKCLRIKPHRKYCVLGDLSKKFGWKCSDLLKKLEDSRRARGASHFARLKTVQKARKTGRAAASLTSDEKALISKIEC